MKELTPGESNAQFVRRYRPHFAYLLEYHGACFSRRVLPAWALIPNAMQSLRRLVSPSLFQSGALVIKRGRVRARRVTISALASLLALTIPQPAAAAPGDPDLTFHGQGWTTVAIDRETREWSVAQRQRQLEAAEAAFALLYV